MNTIDTRDLSERLEELERLETARAEYLEKRSELVSVISEMGADAEDKSVAEGELDCLDEWDYAEELSDDELEELSSLRELCDEIGDEFWHGVLLIPESDFEEYAQELAEDDLGLISSYNQWPLNCIDWEDAARELEHDYCSIQVDGVDYLYRA